MIKVGTTKISTENLQDLESTSLQLNGAWHFRIGISDVYPCVPSQCRSLGLSSPSPQNSPATNIIEFSMSIFSLFLLGGCILARVPEETQYGCPCPIPANKHSRTHTSSYPLTS